MNMTIGTRCFGGVAILNIWGGIALGKETAAMRDTIIELLNQGNKPILLNLGGVDYIDSMGLGSPVGASATVWKQGQP